MSICKRTEPSAARSSADARPDGSIVETDTPARLDRLPWGRFHTLVVVALGITWILDGLEVTLAGAISPALKESPQLRFSNADVGLASSAYLAGAVLGALFFGWLTDRLGRKRLFFITLAVYLLATASTALSWNLASFALFRFFTGAGIGGEYTAINSTIQELVPVRYRGRSGGSAGGARSQPAAAGSGMARGLSDRGRARPRHLPHAPVAAGIAALADDPWPGRRGNGGARSHRGRVPRPRPPYPGRTAAGDPSARAPLHPADG